MSYRIQKCNGKIYYNPNIKSVYYNRSGLKKLFIQYFQYGFYKPLVFLNTKYGMQFHHFVLLAFVIYIVGYTVLYKISAYYLPLVIYLILCFYFSFVSRINMYSKLLCLIVYPIIHISYGIGIFFGLFKLLLR